MEPVPARAKVVVVGAGFAGLTTVRALSGKPVEVVLVDRHNFHTFTPLLYQVASALLDPAEVAHPIRGLVRPLHNLEVRLATATGVDLARRRLETDVRPISYDFLVLATGSATNSRLASSGSKMRPRSAGASCLPSSGRRTRPTRRSVGA
ncbi:MAG: hypothetical protein E6J29_12660 [Chloroflexi bacterium]|nr:MAG: hypothetical protein E6J29_12660 [Chloroflexota bacterium]